MGESLNSSNTAMLEKRTKGLSPAKSEPGLLTKKGKPVLIVDFVSSDFKTLKNDPKNYFKK